MKINKVLLVGYGSIGKRHLKNIQKLLPQAKISILRSQRNNEVVDGCEVVTNIKGAISFNPEVAIICGPSNFHLEIAEQLIAENIHLFIEKPLSNQLVGVADFVKAVEDSGIKAMVGYNLRFNSSLQALKSCIDSRKFGKVLVASAEVGQYLPDWRPDSDYRTTVSAKKDLGGGALLELSHELDFLLWLFGSALSVSAKMLKVSELDIDVEDLVLAHVVFEKEENIVPVNVQLDFLQRKVYRRCKVICEQATIVWDAILAQVEVQTKDESYILFSDDNNKNCTYEAELTAFFNCIENGDDVPISIKEGLNVMQLVEGARLSSESNKVVSL